PDALPICQRRTATRRPRRDRPPLHGPRWGPGGSGSRPAGGERLLPAVLTRWAALEADWQRFYGEPLTEAIHRMTWRRFCVLVRGLPPDAMFHLTSPARRGVNRIEDPDAIETWFTSLARGD